MDVLLCRISVSKLSWLGSRCCTRINAIPEDGGMALMRRLNASRPPAEAPTPITGKTVLPGPGGLLFFDLAMTTARFFFKVTFFRPLGAVERRYLSFIWGRRMGQRR